MQIEFTINGWFDIEEMNETITFSAPTVDGDIVSIKVRGKDKRYIKDLLKALNNLEEINKKAQR